MKSSNLFSKIPKVDDFLNDKDFMESFFNVPRKILLESIRKSLDNLRDEIKSGLTEEKFNQKVSQLKNEIKIKTLEYNDYRFKRVINAAGVVIHTNLGRSLINEEIMGHVSSLITHYSNLEYDLKTGKRGSRYSILNDVIKDITGAEDSLVVNNNAAAVMLVLSTLAKDKEVILSRGEMVEIGGSFRIPEVMETSGAKLVSIGATNKTNIKDYEKAITDETVAFLKVHTSNYRIMGFTDSVDAEDLIPLKEKYNIPIIEDLGSGVLVDLSKYGLEKEPTVQESVNKGIDIITFSGDKLLGGPQAGVIIGKKDFIDKMKKNPLTRALRVDKFTISALEATFKCYYDLDKAVNKIPVLKAITENRDSIKERAVILKEKLSNINGLMVDLEECLSEVGGGSLPTEKLNSYAVTLKADNLTIDKFELFLRSQPIPIITRINNDKIYLDLRTIDLDEVDIIEKSVRDIINNTGEITI